MRVNDSEMCVRWNNEAWPIPEISVSAWLNIDRTTESRWTVISRRIEAATLVHRSLHHALNTSLHPYTPSRQLRSASHNLFSHPYRLCSWLSWFSTCWPFSLEFPPSSSSEIYRLLHCLRIQSKNSPFLWYKHLWPLTILSTRFWFDINHAAHWFYVLRLGLYYVMS